MGEKKVIVLDEYIAMKQKEFPRATGDLSAILRNIGVAAKIVNREVNAAGLVDILGSIGRTNIQGEDVMKLDEFANKEFISSLSLSGLCAGIASEENENIILVDGHNKAKYVVCIDPLDGSSNIDVNVSIGTIFSIYRRKNLDDICSEKDFLQKGMDLMGAGYIIYGSSTMLVYTTGYGVNGFTLDPSIGEFCLSHANITIPKVGKIYSVNQGSYAKFSEGVKAYVDYCMGISRDEPSKPYSLRYIGSMVADLHRNLIKGGIFMYPATSDAPSGKLRLLYECNPMAFIVEQAGGRATDGHRRILEIQPTELHQRTPIFIGSEEMVKTAERFIERYETVGA
ncbi:MAG: fructose-1,6-bisphosphatase class 1 [Chitinophagales bacterium]|nr:MAG: fructose-1,6-bisphosphatase class 1 [Chitinophagales bacterium]